MAARKRKSPKGKAKRRQTGLASRGAVAIGTLGLRGAGALGSVGLRGAGVLGAVIARNPSIAGGAMAFVVIFSFVAANALWYQPGAHPSPFFRTRDPASPTALAGHKPSWRGQDALNTTIFKIERPDDAAPKAGSRPAAASVSAPGSATAPSAAVPPALKLVADIQGELVRRGLYNGAADGVIGPRTTSAILFFQESLGLQQTGEPSPELLAALKSASGGGTAVPIERPAADLTSRAAAIDPVAAAIRSSEKDVRTASNAPKAAVQTAPTSAAVSNATMVMQIQKGLSNIAYSDVSVDGVAGETTRTAILHFQKHYRLPETGEPDAAVLKKLRDIGAL
jgi:peptidoglycan hydrolase-like protein with peptidoglycan-binding domain